MKRFHCHLFIHCRRRKTASSRRGEKETRGRTSTVGGTREEEKEGGRSAENRGRKIKDDGAGRETEEIRNIATKAEVT